MAGSTPNLGLYLPGGGSTGTWVPDEVADVDPFNQNMQKIDAYAGTVGVQTSRNQQFYGPAGAIASVTGMKLGDEYQESDGNKTLWRYDGTNWLTNEGGMWLIRPTSVVNGTIKPNGHVTPTPAFATTSLNGVFSTRFSRYKIVFNTYVGTADTRFMRLRAAGVDNTTAQYWQRGSNSLSGVVAPVTGDSLAYWNVGASVSIHSAGSLEIEGLQSGVHAIVQVAGECHSIAVNGFHAFSAFLNASELLVFDGFTIYNSAGQNWVAADTSDIAVYGIA